MRIALTLALVLLLGACTKPAVSIETRYKTITVTKRGPCPTPAAYELLKRERPNPLRNQAKPGSAAVRVARSQAQLGLYEGEGKWADKAMAALDRCQVVAEEKSETEGVAAAP